MSFSVAHEKRLYELADLLEELDDHYAEKVALLELRVESLEKLLNTRRTEEFKLER